MGLIREIVVSIVGGLLVVLAFVPAWQDDSHLGKPCGLAWRWIVTATIVGLVLCCLALSRWFGEWKRRRAAEREIIDRGLANDLLLQREATVRAREVEWEDILRVQDMGAVVAILRDRAAKFLYFAAQKRAVDALGASVLRVLNATPNPGGLILCYEQTSQGYVLPKGTALEIAGEAGFLGYGTVIDPTAESGQCLVLENPTNYEWIQQIRAQYLHLGPVPVDSIILRPALHPGLSDRGAADITAVAGTLNDAADSLNSVMEDESDTSEGNPHTE